MCRLRGVFQVLPDVLRLCQHGLCLADTAAHAQLEATLQILPLVRPLTSSRYLGFCQLVRPLTSLVRVLATGTTLNLVT